MLLIGSHCCFLFPSGMRLLLCPPKEQADADNAAACSACHTSLTGDGKEANLGFTSERGNNKNVTVGPQLLGTGELSQTRDQCICSEDPKVQFWFIWTWANRWTEVS